MKSYRLILAAAALWFGCCDAQAQSLPQVNLGATSFVDVPPDLQPGLFAVQYGQYYHASRFRNIDGVSIPFPQPKLDVFTSLTQFIFVSDYPLPIKAKAGLDILVPVVDTHVKFGAPGPFPQDNGSGLGDMYIGPALQFDPILNKDGNPIFVSRLEAQMIIPTGKYSSNKAINPGSGFFSFDPYWAGSLFLGPKADVSFRAHYLWNANNDNPNTPGANASRAGQAFHINFASSYEVIEKKLRLGVNGYWLQQTTLSTIDGIDAPGYERIFAIGPGMLVTFSPNTFLFFNYYFENFAEKRTEGNRMTLRFVHQF